MTAQEFLDVYGPSMQYRYAMSEERCHVGRAPSLAASVTEYGYDTMSALIRAYIDDVCQFAGCRIACTPAQMESLIGLILTQHRYLKVTELILYFVKLKSGKWGKLYNQVYAMDITCSLREWQEECIREYNEIRHRQRQAERWGEEPQGI